MAFLSNFTRWLREVHEQASFVFNHRLNAGYPVRTLWRMVRWQARKRLTGGPLDLWLPGKMRLLCPRNSSVAGLVAYTGLHEFEEMSFLLRYLRPGDSFIDVGANIGVYSLLAAGRTQGGRLYAFEPTRDAFEWLRANLRENGLSLTDAQMVAVGETSGSTTLGLTGRSAMNYVVPAAGSNKVTTETVPMVSLDDVIDRNTDERLTLGKIDVEGFEVGVLKGARGLLAARTPPVWIVELSDWVERYGYTRRELLDTLEQAGFGFYDYDPGTNQLQPGDHTLLSRKGLSTRNVLAIADLPFVAGRLEESVTDR